MQKNLVLASGSPRRRELLASLGLAFEILVSDADETIEGMSDPVEIVQVLAYRKARTVANTLSGGLVLGADTIVVHEGQVLGKPSDAAEAKQMLRLLSGRTHRVYTGIALIEAGGQGREVRDARVTKVTMKTLTPEQIDAYVATGEPFDKAGGYAIQGLAAQFVIGIEGDYFTVVGLPISLVADRLAEFGFDVLPRRQQTGAATGEPR